MYVDSYYKRAIIIINITPQKMINGRYCTQDRTTILLELEEVKARLEEEQRTRANEQYINDLKIASLTSNLEETTQKLKKYGVRQKKLLHKNKTFEIDLTVRIKQVKNKDEGFHHINSSNDNDNNYLYIYILPGLYPPIAKCNCYYYYF